MIDLLLLLMFAAVLNWAVVDIYFFSIIFEPLQQYGKNWEQSTGYFQKHFRYLLQCPFCFSHWSAAAILAMLWFIGYCGYLPVPLHLPTAILAIPAVARVSVAMRDYSLPPITYIPDNNGQNGSQSDSPEESAGDSNKILDNETP